MPTAVTLGIESALAALLPPGTAVAAAPVAVAGLAPLLPAEAAAAQSMVSRRRQEFAAGRACARQALASLGLPPQALPVAGDRSAIWPPGTCGSITHAGDWAAAAAAPVARLAGLGIDLEDCAPLDGDLVARLCRPEELARPPPDLPPALWSRTVFSAKESVYKCVRARVGRFIDFDEVQVVATAAMASGPGGSAGLLTFEAVGSGAELDVVGDLVGGYALAGGLIVTAVWLAPPAATGR
jgi:4'-phosphopantetheinyl transferase EntD